MDRFWKKVKKIPGGCWQWMASVRNADGYGQFNLSKGKVVYSHRYAYELLVGPIESGKVIDHLCRNRACCNPSHMEIVEVKINVQRGVSSPLDSDKVLEIKRLHKEGKTAVEIGKMFGVSRVCIDFIVKGKRWSNV